MTGDRGNGSEANRRCMIWDENEQDLSFKQFISELIALRKTAPDFNSPTLQWLEANNDHCIAYQRGQWQIIMNNSSETQMVQIQGESTQLLPFGYQINKVL